MHNEKKIVRKERKGRYLIFLHTSYGFLLEDFSRAQPLFTVQGKLLSPNKQKRKINGFLILRWKKCFLSIKAKTETKGEKKNDNLQ